MLDVYKECYYFDGNPFRLSPDHGFSFAHHSYANARDFLKYGIIQGEGFVVITGGAGTGKTTLINHLIADLDTTRVAVAKLITAQLDSCNFLKIVIHAFGLDQIIESELSPLLQLEQFLLQQDKSGRRAVLIVDEAQGLSPHSLEELRLLSNIQSGNRLLLQIILVGQEHLMEMIHAPGMKNLRQRIVAVSSLEPLDMDDTIAYVEHRLCNVGWKGDPVISEAALQLVHEFSEGVPRQINLICHRLFLSGGLRRKHDFGSEEARRVIEELLQEGLLDDELSDDVSNDERVAAQFDSAETLSPSLPRPEGFARVEHSPRPSHRVLRAATKTRTSGDASRFQSVSPKRNYKGTSYSAGWRSRLPNNEPAVLSNVSATMNSDEKNLSEATEHGGPFRMLGRKLIERIDVIRARGWRLGIMGVLVAGCLTFVMAKAPQINSQIQGFLHTASNLIDPASGAAASVRGTTQRDVTGAIVDSDNASVRKQARIEIEGDCQGALAG